jgi:methyl-accepting chemotaxis protein
MMVVMRKFSDWLVLYKLLALVAALALVIGAVVVVGIYGVKTFDAETNVVADAGIDAALGERIQKDVNALTSAEFRLAASPTPEIIAAVEGEIATSKARLEQSLDDGQKTADADQMAKLTALRDALKTYFAEIDKTVAKAKELGAQVQADTARRQIIDAAMASRDEGENADKTAAAYSDISKAEMEQELRAADRLSDELDVTMIVTALLGIVGGLVLGYVMAAYAIARPITRSVARLKLLSEGDTSTEILGIGRQDEIGQIAGTMQVFRDNLIKNREMQAREAEAQAARVERAEKIDRLTVAFDHASSAALKTVAAAATELQATASSMNATAEETSRQASVVASASEETTANVQTVAAATEELSASIHEITSQVTESTRIVGEAVQQAQDTNAKVQGLADAAQKIGDVVRIISEIAGQTNLLALNATIEAARAGEMGKGFAVVASEVKTLATQTAKATDEISGQVRSIQEATTSSASAIRDIGGTINRVNEIATAIASAVEEQGAATQEISRNVQQAAQGTQEVSTNIVSVSTAAEHTGSAASEVLTAAGELAMQAEVIRGEVEKYIAGVRAA